MNLPGEGILTAFKLSAFSNSWSVFRVLARGNKTWREPGGFSGHSAVLACSGSGWELRERAGWALLSAGAPAKNALPASTV